MNLRATARLVPFAPIGLALLAGGFLVWRAQISGDVATLVLALALAVGAAPTLADAAAITLAPSPTSRAWRAAARLGLVLPLGALGFVVVRDLSLRHVAGALPTSGVAAWFPTGDEWLLVAVLVTTSLAVEAAADRDGSGSGYVGGISALVLAAVALRLPDPLALMPVEAHRWRWAAMLWVSAALLASGLADPGRASLARRYSR